MTENIKLKPCDYCDSRHNRFYKPSHFNAYGDCKKDPIAKACRETFRKWWPVK